PNPSPAVAAAKSSTPIVCMVTLQPPRSSVVGLHAPRQGRTPNRGKCPPSRLEQRSRRPDWINAASRLAPDRSDPWPDLRLWTPSDMIGHSLPTLEEKPYIPTMIKNRIIPAVGISVLIPLWVWAQDPASPTNTAPTPVPVPEAASGSATA